MKDGFIKLIRLRLFLIILAVLVFSTILTGVIAVNSKNSVEEAIIINTFGRQRMLTQMMAKDVNRKYSIMLSIQNGPFVESAETLHTKIQTINKNLLNAKVEFESVMSSLQTGMLADSSGEISISKTVQENALTTDKLEQLWAEFESSLSVILNADKASKETAEALIFINANNEQLLNYCDNLNQAIVLDVERSYRSVLAVALVLFLLSISALIFSAYQLRKYIVAPLSGLYSGLREKGLLNIRRGDKLHATNELEPFLTAIDEGFSKLDKTFELIENINKSLSFQEVLEYIYTTFRAFIPYRHIGIALLEGGGNVLNASYAMSDGGLPELPKRLHGIQASIKDTSLKSVIREGKPRIINDLEAYTAGKRLSEYNRIILEEGIRASITLPLNVGDQPVGVIFFSSTTKNVYEEEHVRFLETLANSIAITLNQSIFIDELLFSSVLALAKMAEARDEETGEHLERMEAYSAAITGYLMEDDLFSDTIDIDFIRSIERFSPMHDIGKVGVKDGILLKPGKLTPAEFEDMKKHTVYGAQILAAAENNILTKQKRSIFRMGIEIAVGHHEKWNGSGYPRGRSGADIPLAARIVAAADVLDALTSKRPYKEAFSFEDSFEMIMSEKGKHFDPVIVDCMIRHKAELEQLYQNFQAVIV